MKENYEEKTLTLTLPFLDFKGTDVDTGSMRTYNMSGHYFVRNTIGEFLIASVNKEENNLWVHPVVPGLLETFFHQDMEQQSTNKLQQLEQRLIDIHNDIFAKLDEQQHIVRSDIHDVCHIANRIEDNVGILANIEEHLSSCNPNTEHPNGGYVDQDVLLQIIKEVKR